MNPRAGPYPGAEASVAWPDLRGRLDQVGALAAELAAVAEERARLARRLEAALEGRRESMRQGAALDEMRRRLERRRARVDDLAVARRRAAEGLERQKEQMQAQIERVLPLSRALAAAHRQVQEAKELKSAEKARLGDLQRLLRTRQQSMVAQVAALYPVRVFRELAVAQNHHSHTNERAEHHRKRMGHFHTRTEMERICSVSSNLHMLVPSLFLAGKLESPRQSSRVTVTRSFRGQQLCSDIQHMSASSSAWICDIRS